METLKKFLSWLKALPLWLRLVVLLALAVAGAWSLSSCANTKAVVRASSENTSASVTITTNNPTTVNVTNKQDTIGLLFNPRKTSCILPFFRSCPNNRTDNGKIKLRANAYASSLYSQTDNLHHRGAPNFLISSRDALPFGCPPSLYENKYIPLSRLGEVKHKILLSQLFQSVRSEQRREFRHHCETHIG